MGLFVGVLVGEFTQSKEHTWLLHWALGLQQSLSVTQP